MKMLFERQMATFFVYFWHLRLKGKNNDFRLFGQFWGLSGYFQIDNCPQVLKILRSGPQERNKKNFDHPELVYDIKIFLILWLLF